MGLKSFSSDERSPPPLPKQPVGKGSRGIEGVAIANIFLVRGHGLFSIDKRCGQMKGRMTPLKCQSLSSQRIQGIVLLPLCLFFA